MPRLALLLLALLPVFLGIALAQDTIPGGETIKRVFNVLLQNPVDTFGQRLGRFIGPLANPVTMLAWALFVVALIYRMYDIATSDVDPGVAIYTLIRFAFLALFLTMSNYALENRGFPITGGDDYNINPSRFSSVAYVGWLRAYDAGKERFVTDTVIDRFQAAITNYTQTLIYLATLKKIGDFLSVVREVLEAKLFKKKRAMDEPKPEPQPQPPSPTQGKTLFQALVEGVIAPIMYFFLAIPLVIYSFALWGIGLANLLATILIPIGIVLVAFGNTGTIIRIAGTIFTAHVTTYFMPLIFVVGTVLSLEVPAGVMKRLTEAADAAFAVSIQEARQLIQQDLDNIPDDPPPDNALDWFFQQLKNILAEIGEKISAILQSIGITLMLFLAMFVIAVPLMIAITVISFNAALQFILKLPEILGSLISGTAGVFAVPGTTARAKQPRG